MHTVCLSLDWLKGQLQSAGLQPLDEAEPEEVRAFRCEPWALLGIDEHEWIVQGNFEDRSISLMENDGTELTRVGVADDHLLDAVLQLIQRRVGRPLRTQESLQAAIRAELAAAQAANDTTKRLMSNMTGRNDGRVQA
jgi:hypothetical protein